MKVIFKPKTQAMTYLSDSCKWNPENIQKLGNKKQNKTKKK